MASISRKAGSGPSVSNLLRACKTTCVSSALSVTISVLGRSAFSPRDTGDGTHAEFTCADGIDGSLWNRQNGAFPEAECESFVKLDFVEHPDYREIFSGSLAAGDLYSRITLFVPGVRIIPGKTQLFLDELQECPEARSAFKHLTQDGNVGRDGKEVTLPHYLAPYLYR